ncbi:MAG TPA: efflux RND transporter permease subunit [Pseudomonadales bacterium]|nr:efflux RND transporter permease subunit [Pseudomonadales bacterium]
MKLTDIFVRRPVLASVISLLILVLGVRSILSLEIREYPKTEQAVVTVTTAFPGADADLVQSFITEPLQRAASEAEGIDYVTSVSRQGVSVIQAFMALNYDPYDALAEIQGKIASERNNLPREARDPVISLSTSDGWALIYMALTSENMNTAQMTDYSLRSIVPRLQALPGVAKAGINGDQTMALRVWLDPQRLTALDLTAADVRRALLEENVQSAVGRTKGDSVMINLSATTNLSTVAEFENLVLRTDGSAVTRLKDVAEVRLSTSNPEQASWFSGRPCVMLALTPTPGANPLTLSAEVNALLPDIVAQLPPGMELSLIYDGSLYIEDSIAEVYTTLAEALAIVLVVIFLSLGTWQAAVIPALAVPLSLVGGAFLMLLMGFSLNLLTLLAMLLAIGLVVDDAIVVVENVHRHISEGKTPFEAALAGARELVMPIISMTTTLVAVYIPIGFMGGLAGSLFTEFAYTLAGTVVVSGIVALTLAPMLAARILPDREHGTALEHFVDKAFGLQVRIQQFFLRDALRFLPVPLLVAATVTGSIWFMYQGSTQELAPTEDREVLNVQISAPETATLEYTATYAAEVVKAFESFPEYLRSFLLLGGGGTPATSFGGFRFVSVAERERSQMELQPLAQQLVSRIPGIQVAVFTFPSLPGGARGTPLQFVLTGDAPYAQLVDLADELIGKGYGSGNFVYLRKSAEIALPLTRLEIDRDRAGDLGVDMDEFGMTMATLLGGGYVSRFNQSGRSYEVIPQVARRYRLDESLLEDYRIRGGDGELIPLASFVSLAHEIEPTVRAQFQQLNSVTISGLMAPGVSLGDAMTWMEATAATTLPQNIGYDYTGESRQLMQQGNALLYTFFLSLLVIYLVLAAQYESWRDPLIILVSVPMSIAGALLFIYLGFASINLYTQIGLITLIGLIAKNGILIVDFANRLQETEGLDKRDAVARAVATRYRPIMMTTVAMLMAMVPLLLATGPGSVSRSQMGLVIFTGLGIGTLFTLFVVPAVYVLLARDRNPELHEMQDGAREHPAI